ncbi:MAG: nuclear transport factor 2 family protein [Chloroflexi bacterium]|nr:nuclear transport factor 2 family protein [Chloroflexota bacterium]
MYWSLLQFRLRIFAFERRLPPSVTISAALAVAILLLPSAELTERVSQRTPQAIVRSYYSAVDGGDLNAVMALFAANARLYFGSLRGQGTALTGRSKIREYYARFYFLPVPAHHKINELMVQGDDAFVHLTTVYPDSPVQFPQWEHFTIRAGKIVAITEDSTRGVDHLPRLGGS